jgi:hypothetical protein
MRNDSSISQSVLIRDSYETRTIVTPASLIVNLSVPTVVEARCDVPSGTQRDQITAGSDGECRLAVAWRLPLKPRDACHSSSRLSHLSRL